MGHVRDLGLFFGIVPGGEQYRNAFNSFMLSSLPPLSRSKSTCGDGTDAHNTKAIVGTASIEIAARRVGASTRTRMTSNARRGGSDDGHVKLPDDAPDVEPLHDVVHDIDEPHKAAVNTEQPQSATLVAA